jgi:DNA primase
MSRIAQETIEQVAAASDIVQVVGGYFPLRRAGTEFRALCPFHQEKSPSFFVNPAKQQYYCFGCGAGGSVFQFVQQYENVDFPEAVRRLANRAGIVIIENEYNVEEEARQSLRKRLLRLHFEAAAWFHRNLLRTKAAEPARQYLKGRGLNIEIAKNWEIGYSPDAWESLAKWGADAGFSRDELVSSGLVKLKEENNPRSRIYDRFRGRLMFPIRNDIGEVIAFSGRVLDPKAKGGKYVNSPETLLFTKGNILFGLDKSKRFIANARQAIVLEGQLDLITTFEAGIQNVVAPQGTALTERHGALLRRFCDEVILFFDADNAGQKAAERALEVLYGAGLQVRIGDLPSGEDPDSLIRRAGGEAFVSRVEAAQDFFDHQMQRNFTATESKTTAGRVAFARKMSQFIAFVPDAILRDTLISRLAARLTLPRETLEQMIRAQSKQSFSKTIADDFEPSTIVSPRHDVALICKSLLIDTELLLEIRRQPWDTALHYIEGAELIHKIIASDLQPDRSASIAAFFGSLPKTEAALLSQILANKNLNEKMGRVYWTQLIATELQRRKVQLQHIGRLAPEGSEAQTETANELKEVLDLESRITDISRLPSRVP